MWVNFNHPYLLSKRDSGDGTCTKMMHILYTFWWYPYCWWHPIQIWSYTTLKSTMFVQCHNMCKLNHLCLLSKEDISNGSLIKMMHIFWLNSVTYLKPSCSEAVCDFADESKHLWGHDGTYTKDAHSMYLLMIPIHSGVFGAWYSNIANNVKVILYFLISMIPHASPSRAFSTSNANKWRRPVVTCWRLGRPGSPMNEVISLILLEHGLIAVMHLSVVCPIPPIPGFGGGKEGNWHVLLEHTPIPWAQSCMCTTPLHISYKYPISPCCAQCVTGRYMGIWGIPKLRFSKDIDNTMQFE